MELETPALKAYQFIYLSYICRSYWIVLALIQGLNLRHHQCIVLFTYLYLCLLFSASFHFVVEMAVDKGGASPFCVACDRGYVKVLDWLLTHGISSSEMIRAGIYFLENLNTLETDTTV